MSLWAPPPPSPAQLTPSYLLPQPRTLPTETVNKACSRQPCGHPWNGAPALPSTDEGMMLWGRGDHHVLSLLAPPRPLSVPWVSGFEGRLIRAWGCQSFPRGLPCHLAARLLKQETGKKGTGLALMSLCATVPMSTNGLCSSCPACLQVSPEGLRRGKQAFNSSRWDCCQLPKKIPCIRNLSNPQNT